MPSLKQRYAGKAAPRFGDGESCVEALPPKSSRKRDAAPAQSQNRDDGDAASQTRDDRNWQELRERVAVLESLVEGLRALVDSERMASHPGAVLPPSWVPPWSPSSPAFVPPGGVTWVDARASEALPHMPERRRPGRKTSVTPGGLSPP